MFKHKRIIITGASRGLGRALALAFAKQGAQLALFARDAKQLHAVQTECQALGATCIIVPGDVTQPNDCAALIQQAVESFQGIDYLINNAGTSMWANFTDISDLSLFEKLIRVNYLGAVYCTHYALPYLKKSRGMIVAISSLQGKHGVPYHTAYSAAKHALNGFLDALRIELIGSGVDILTVNPSWIADTDLRAHALNEKGQPLGKQHHASSASAIPLNDLCHAIVIGMQKCQREINLPRNTRWLTFLKVVSPRLVDRIIAYKIQQHVES